MRTLRVRARILLETLFHEMYHDSLRDIFWDLKPCLIQPHRIPAKVEKGSRKASKEILANLCEHPLMV